VSSLLGLPSGFNWKEPDYNPVFRKRWQVLERLRDNPEQLPAIKQFYRERPAQFINDWGVTYDPRNVERGLPPLVPFLLFPRQAEWIDYVLRKWRAQEPGLTEKSRECGVTWLAVATACTLGIFYEGVSIGFGSRKAEYVDKIGELKSIIEKGRVFMSALPHEFRAGWVRELHAPHMRMRFPDTGSNIGGEGGDDIGRGDRRSIYFVDEAAHLERPESVDAALSMTTNCRIDVSSVNGSANPFAIKRHSGMVEVFTFHWRDDPRKDQAWYDRKAAEIGDPVIVAQELDIDYQASTEGALIPSAWVQSAIDAHVRLSFPPSGARYAAFDVADEGPDACAFVGAHGVVVEVLEQWSGKGSDIYQSVAKCFDLCDQHGYEWFRYDADGLGADVRGDARVLNTQRGGRRPIRVETFRGSGEVVDPKREDVKGRLNIDYFRNAKAQAWWSLRIRFLKTHRAVTGERTYSPDELISLSSDLKLLRRLCVELSQPTYQLNQAGKVVVDKTPDGARSPNLADGVMIRMAAAKRAMVISDAVIARARAGGLRR